MSLTSPCLFLSLLFCCCLPAAKAETPVREWGRVEVAKPRFTGTALGLLEAEIAPFAAFLAIHAYNTQAEKVWAGDLEAHLAARRQISLALNLCPLSTEAKGVNTWLFLKTRPGEKLALPYTEEMFADAVDRAILRLRGSGNITDAIRQGIGYLALAAVEFAPTNENLVYEAEMFLRGFANESDAWRALHQAK